MDEFCVDCATVIGLGSWGTAASGLVARHAKTVKGWVFEPEIARAINERHVNPVYLKTYELPQNVHATTSLEEALQGTQAVVIVVPSAFLRSTCAQMAPFVPADVPVLVLTKGIEPTTGLLMTEVVAQEVGGEERIACLSGPNHAEEISQGKPAAAVIAAPVPEVAGFFQQLMIAPTFRAYVGDDVVGVEVCAAMKNVIAIACGIAAGIDLGDNALSVLMTRGLAEIGRFAFAMGGKPLTCMGLAGMGDMITTCTSPHSRNRTFGAALAHGETLESYQARTHMVVEGAVAAVSVHELSERLGVETPISSAVWEILYNGGTVAQEMKRLNDRLPQDEFYGFDV